MAPASYVVVLVKDLASTHGYKTKMRKILQVYGTQRIHTEVIKASWNIEEVAEENWEKNAEIPTYHDGYWRDYGG